MQSDEISTQEAAEILKCSQRTIQRMIERGSLKGRKLDPHAKSIYLVSRREVMELSKAKPSKPERTKQS